MILLLTVLLTSSVTITEVDRSFGYGADHASEIRGLEILERALIDAPSDYDLLWRTARSYYYVGDGAPSGERLVYFERGIDVSKGEVA
jgi:hypothetical protein